MIWHISSHTKTQLKSSSWQCSKCKSHHLVCTAGRIPITPVCLISLISTGMFLTIHLVWQDKSAVCCTWVIRDPPPPPQVYRGDLSPRTNGSYFMFMSLITALCNFVQTLVGGVQTLAGADRACKEDKRGVQTLAGADRACKEDKRGVHLTVESASPASRERLYPRLLEHCSVQRSKLLLSSVIRSPLSFLCSFVLPCLGFRLCFVSCFAAGRCMYTGCTPLLPPPLPFVYVFILFCCR